MNNFYYVIAFIIIDLVTGTLRSLIIDKDWKSSKFRVGLYKKSSEIAIVLLSYLIDEYCISVVEHSLNLYTLTGIYVSVMEIMSILENFSYNKELSGLIDTIKMLVTKFKNSEMGGDDEDGSVK